MEEKKGNQFIKLYAWMIQELGLSGNELILYAYLYRFVEAGMKEIHPAMSTIAEETGIHRVTVQRLLVSLSNRKMIKVSLKQNVHPCIVMVPYSEISEEMSQNATIKKLQNATLMLQNATLKNSKCNINVAKCDILPINREFNRESVNREFNREEEGKEERSSSSSSSSSSLTDKERIIRERCFNAFIEKYPKNRIGNKSDLIQLWNTIDMPSCFDKMMSLIQSRKSDGSWLEDDSRYCPYARKFITERYWEKYIASENSDVTYSSIVEEMASPQDIQKRYESVLSNFSI